MSSARHMLAPQSPVSARDSDYNFRPPSAPFTQFDAPGSSNGSADSSRPNSASGSLAELSLTVNYVPSKFSASLLSPTGPRRRKGKDVLTGTGAMGIPRGGGVEAFRSGEARMPGEHDEDYNGVNVRRSWFGLFSERSRGQAAPLRWNMFKWILFLANTIFSLCSVASLVFCLLVWFDTLHNAEVIRVGNRAELILSTFAASFGLITSIVGWAGILLNNRGFLAVYTFLLWLTFAFMIIPGYLTYKKRTFNLEGKLNQEWSRALGTDGRLRVQNRLSCCGWFSPFVEATITQTCYSRSVLPGCKLRYMDWQRYVLGRWYTIIFSLVPVQLLVIVAGLLCSNHVTYRFGKGMMPKRYRLDPGTMKVIVDNYTNELTTQNGHEVSDVAKAGMHSPLRDAASPTAQMSAMPYAYPSNEKTSGKDEPRYASL